MVAAAVGTIGALAALAVRSRAPRAVSVAAGHVLVVGAVAWYVIDAVWGSIPASASLTPVPPVAFVAAWVCGAIYLLLAAPALGAACVLGLSVGPDPLAARPPGTLGRAAAAWPASVLLVSLVALAATPVYLALWALGATPGTVSGGRLLVHAAIVLLAPLAGIAPAVALRRRRGR
jgi:hypothetical protein